jgi:hypothetical protein
VLTIFLRFDNLSYKRIFRSCRVVKLTVKDSTMNNKEETRERVQVQVVTVSGNYPEDGYKKYQGSDLLRKVLEEAKNHLELHDTENWMAKLDGRILDPNLSLEANHVPGKAQIMWAKDEHGGGWTR